MAVLAGGVMAVPWISVARWHAAAPAAAAAAGRVAREVDIRAWAPGSASRIARRTAVMTAVGLPGYFARPVGAAAASTGMLPSLLFPHLVAAALGIQHRTGGRGVGRQAAGTAHTVPIPVTGRVAA